MGIQHDVPDSLRSDRCCALRQGRRPERPGPPALQRVRRHLLQGQRRCRLRRLGACPQPLGLLLQPLVSTSPPATSERLSHTPASIKKENMKPPGGGQKKKKKKKKKK